MCPLYSLRRLYILSAVIKNVFSIFSVVKNVFSICTGLGAAVQRASGQTPGYLGWGECGPRGQDAFASQEGVRPTRLLHQVLLENVFSVVKKVSSIFFGIRPRRLLHQVLLAPLANVFSM